MRVRKTPVRSDCLHCGRGLAPSEIRDCRSTCRQCRTDKRWLIQIAMLRELVKESLKLGQPEGYRQKAGAVLEATKPRGRYEQKASARAKNENEEASGARPDPGEPYPPGSDLEES